MWRRRLTDKERLANYEREKVVVRETLLRAAQAFEDAATALRGVVAKGSFTIGELRETRTLVLRAVRFDLDEYACGHMPDKRYY